ncbi:uncharacterized protein KY384_004771 [Bacidia gigantensis]|uniref:uncharacterized protein n=1 Tax=Bacidia gigantensis TaxID=2732470 RepID=UPI001D05AA15|nr:uncharacterized protein KY384_004771 [Bacidia gigantensis]KAG8530270.1 hypothetical protein KY384_004771 [Bacidia gigantensis]
MGDLAPSPTSSIIDVVGPSHATHPELKSYTALPDSHSIRMLVLEPGSPIDPLRGRLEIVDINSAGSYEPVSYVWGTSKLVDKIYTRHGSDDGPLRLTASLKEALVRFRLPDQERRLWADQICINQSDVAERSQQVQFMKRIYENASHVLVWLGADGTSLAKPAFELIRDLNQLFQNELQRGEFYTEHTNRLGEQSRDKWKALDHLADCPWFTRGWIVQEIGTRASATLFWGDEEIDWTVLHTVCETLTAYHHLRTRLNIRTSEIKYVFRRFVEPDMTSHHANRVNFIYELQRARGLKFTDHRDRVYAWLGHYSKPWTFKSFAELLTADYEKTLAEVYIDVAKLALKAALKENINDGSGLIVLAAVQHMHLRPSEIPMEARLRDRLTDKDSLPSWVPDWRTYQSFILSEPINPHRAHGSTTPILAFEHNDRLLRISGIRIDEIELCSRPLAIKEFHLTDSSEATESTIEYIWRHMCGKNEFNLTGQYLSSDESCLFACMQTLSNGCVQIATREKMQYHSIPKSYWLEQEALYLAKALGQSDKIAPELHRMAEMARSVHMDEQWSRSANGASKNRVFAKTQKGFYVLGPKVAEPGDIVCVLFGGKLPFCLRPLGDQYLLVGECYVHGLMNGEAMDMMSRQELIEEAFDIV